MSPAAAIRVFVAALLAFALGGCALAPAVGADDARRIAGKTYVVTGASSGFGRGVASRLGGLGANVVLAARRTELLEEVAREVRNAGGKALVVTTDVASPDDVERLMSATLARFGRVDVWINNAGVGATGRFEDGGGSFTRGERESERRDLRQPHGIGAVPSAGQRNAGEHRFGRK